MADNRDDINLFTNTSTKVFPKKYHSVKCLCQIDVPNLASYGSKVPDQITSFQDKRLGVNLASHNGSCTSKFAPKNTNERRIAYAEMARNADGSTVLLEEGSNGQCVVPGWDYIDVAMSTDSKDNLSPSGKSNDLQIRNLNYADIDFLPINPKCQANLFSSSRTKYACIDLNKTLAIRKAGKELLQGKNATASNKCKTLSNYYLPLKKASSCFYVSMPADQEPPVAKDEPISDAGTSIKSKKNLRSPASQRKHSFDFCDSSKYPNTLPHSKKKFN